MKQKPIRTRRQRRPKSIRKRLRSVFADGFSFGVVNPKPHEVTALREAMRELAADDAYWKDIEVMAQLNRRVMELREALR